MNHLTFSPDVDDNQLIIAGKTAKEIAVIAGSTPCYVYDRKFIIERIFALKQQLPERLHLHYAMKANPMPALVTHIAGLVDGLDVASHKEMLLALASGMEARKISIAGPGKSNTQLTAAITAGVVINIESANELLNVQQLAQQLSKRAHVAFRINPDFEVKGAGMKMTGGAKPFGIDAETFKETFSLLDANYCHFVGFHIFCGSQLLAAPVLVDIYRQVFALAVKLAEDVGVVPEQINIGGGFGVPYFPQDKALDVAYVCQHLAQLIDDLPQCYQEVELHLELGRYLVAHAGTYLCQIRDIKHSREQEFWVCNGGMHHHLSNSGNFGQVIRRNYPVLLANKVAAEQQVQVNIVGPLCTPLDIVANNVALPQAQVGDYVAVLMSGAYGATASPQQFLSQGEVVELLL